MALSRWTKARLRIVAVVTASAAGIGIAISWLLSRILESPYDFAEFEQGARNGLTVGIALTTVDLFYFQGPRRVIGGRALNNLLLGRYHQPVREERVFLLIDIKGSTALAERLGDREAP
jgi:hypothetical protein